eukprot:TRINITY_DN6826_c0_g1_i2.p1 TRINITY_DN6826_c0_g1~~TRINITY_DN6826_c0_g1_i2.p1  ORF type:complete len:611 (-),score=160.44 TRINITY_DN6826_c0_g1_i2:1071-2858(-)
MAGDANAEPSPSQEACAEVAGSTTSDTAMAGDANAEPSPSQEACAEVAGSTSSDAAKAGAAAVAEVVGDATAEMTEEASAEPAPSQEACAEVQPGSQAEAGAEVVAAAMEPSAGVEAAGEAKVSEYAEAAAEADAEAAGSGSVDIELCFFRATLRSQQLARRMGRVPALHVAVATSDGLRQVMEFIGVHQRQYCVEDPPRDAISRNLVESLLKVVLEFVFHPSRTRYVKAHVVLRECSSDPEVRRQREVLLPLMVDKVREGNPVIKHVSIEFCEARARTFPRDGKRKSYLVLDEDVLKVAPVRQSMMTKAPSAKGSFSGFGQGFLNSQRAKTRGLEDARKPVIVEVPSSGSSSSSAPAPSISERIKPGERTRINPKPYGEAVPPPVESTRDEKRKMLLGSAELRPEVAEMSGIYNNGGRSEGGASSSSAPVGGQEGGGATPVRADLEDTEDQEESEQSTPQANNISELANRLFGADAAEEAALDLDASDDENRRPDDGRTDSTTTPSPKASSLASRGEHAPSERSEPVTEEGTDLDASGGASGSTPAPVGAGFRLLQQRRQERRRCEEAEQARAAAEQSDRPLSIERINVSCSRS